SSGTWWRRYILQPEIFSILAGQERGSGDEIQITDAMITLMNKMKQPFYAVRFDGKIYDCGSKIGFLMANVAYALERDDLASEFKSELAKVL
ncbi:MAG: UTP--glucose-1-phosphate uridylyltransferase, partial [Hyphomicrobiaceae bacterium]|nr:UTP--glucose-1-phosphate uridylyltransferase [Hyphomicrobiaceae bacterium]